MAFDIKVYCYDYIIKSHAGLPKILSCWLILQMHRLAPAFRTCFRCAARPWVISPRVLARRPLTSSSQGLPGETFTADLIEEPDVIGDFETGSMGDEGSETPRSYRAFMDKIGSEYRFARPQKWLSRNAVKCLIVLLFNVDSFPCLLSPSP